MRKFNCLWLVLLSVVLNACTTLPSSKRYTLVSPGVVIVNKFQVENPRYWSQQTAGQSVSWTKDGVLLNEIVFSEISQGQDILGQTGANAHAFEFEPAMSMPALVELFLDALSIRDYHNVRLVNEQPFIIDGDPAIRFALSYDSDRRLNYSAQAIFIKRDERLYTIYCSAPSGYLFDNVQPYFKIILDSVRLR